MLEMKWERKSNICEHHGPGCRHPMLGSSLSSPLGALNTGSHGGAGTNCKGCHTEGCGSGQGQEGAPRGKPSVS